MQGFTIKSNARRAARKAGLDCDALDFVCVDGLWEWNAPAMSPSDDRLVRTDQVLSGAQLRELLGDDDVDFDRGPHATHDGEWVSEGNGNWRFFLSPDVAEDADHNERCDAFEQFCAERRVAGMMQVLVAMLWRAEGATVKEISAATGWLGHTARARISADIGRKLDLEVITRDDAERGRVYRVTGARKQTQGALL